MAELKALLTILRLLPDFIELAKKIGGAIEEGVDTLRVQAAMKRIDKAFLIQDPKKRAGELNDEFSK